MSLKNKAIVFFVVCIIVPTILVGWYSSQKAGSTIKGQVGEALLELLKQNHVTINRVVNLIDENSIKICTAPAMKNMLNDRLPEKQRFADAQDLLSRYSSLNNRQPRYTLFMTGQGGDDWPDGFDRLSNIIYVYDNNKPSWFTEAVENAGTGGFRIIDDWSSYTSGQTTLAYIRAVTQLQGKAVNGVLVVSNLEFALQPDLESVELPAGGQVILTDYSNQVLVSTTDTPRGSTITLPQQQYVQQEGVVFASEQGEKWLYISHYSSSYSTRLIYKIPAQSLTGRLASINHVILATTIMYFVLMVIFIAYIGKSVVYPIVQLTRLTTQYTPEMIQPEWSKPERADEIGRLYSSFRRMTRRLNQLVQEKYVMELKQKEIQLMTLQSQITPHLLYNTLDSIYWHGIKGGVPEVAEMVRDLSALMRIGLSKGKEIIAYSEELEHVQSYIRLQMKRYKDAFQVHTEIDDGSKACLVPKVILQPLVENAIFHGIGKMDGEGELWIKTKVVGERLEIRIEDNGFKPVDLEAIQLMLADEPLTDAQKEKGYGIRNVNKRIQLHFGHHYGIAYSMRPGGGTVAAIHLPVIKKEGD